MRCDELDLKKEIHGMFDGMLGSVRRLMLAVRITLSLLLRFIGNEPMSRREFAGKTD